MRLSDTEWLVMATKFMIWQDDEDVCESNMIYIEARMQEDASYKWVVKTGSFVLDMETFEVVYEPFPSSRTRQFIDATRFDTKDEAYEAFLKWKEANLKPKQCT